MKLDMEKTVQVLDGVTVQANGTDFVVKGPKGELKRSFRMPAVKVAVEGNTVKLSVTKGTKREKVMLHTIVSHLKNMIDGAANGYEYKLKVCSGHFPMTVTLKGETFEVKNYIGEAVPRKLKIKPDVQVKVDGEIITVTSTDKELAGQQAAEIEKLCRRSNFDNRIFQDGIYIIEKAGKSIM